MARDQQQLPGSVPSAPPGSDECAYYWYLDATDRGVALVLSWPLAYDVDGVLGSVELTMCITEPL